MFTRCALPGVLAPKNQESFMAASTEASATSSTCSVLFLGGRRGCDAQLPLSAHPFDAARDPADVLVYTAPGVAQRCRVVRAVDHEKVGEAADEQAEERLRPILPLLGQRRPAPPQTSMRLIEPVPASNPVA